MRFCKGVTALLEITGGYGVWHGAGDAPIEEQVSMDEPTYIIAQVNCIRGDSIRRVIYKDEDPGTPAANVRVTITHSWHSGQVAARKELLLFLNTESSIEDLPIPADAHGLYCTMEVKFELLKDLATQQFLPCGTIQVLYNVLPETTKSKVIAVQPRIPRRLRLQP